MYGLLVHFGTFWMYGIYTHGVSDGEEAVCLEDRDAVPLPFTKNPDSSTFSWIWCVLLLHEYWVYLQHSNVLANPYCQRLDRQYGIALLKSNQHWAIAGEPCSYLCHVVLLGTLDPYMILCFRFGWHGRNFISLLVPRKSLHVFVPPFSSDQQLLVHQILDHLFFGLSYHQEPGSTSRRPSTTFTNVRYHADCD